MNTKISSNKKNTKDFGYITLISVLVMSAVSIAIATSLILLGISSSRTSFAVEQSNQAQSLANACVESALDSLKQDGNYPGNENISLGQGSCDILPISIPSVLLEAGIVSTDENWVQVNMQNSYTSPIVVASFQETDNTLPASVRIRNLTNSSFEIRIQHPGDNDLSPDTISYFVIEEGTWEIGGVKLEAHKYNTNTIGRSGNWAYDTVTFDHTFASDPIVLHQVMSNNDSTWITTYVSRSNSQTNPPDTSGARIALNGAEAVTSHGIETIGWIAIDRDITGDFDGTDFETYRTPDAVLGHANGCYVYNYQSSYTSTPIVLGFQEEMDGGNGGWSVTCSNSLTQVGMHVEEDDVGDSERNHTTETFSYIAFADSFDADVIVNANGRVVKTKGTIGSIVRKVKVILSQVSPSIGIDSWQEVADL